MISRVIRYSFASQIAESDIQQTVQMLKKLKQDENRQAQTRDLFRLDIGLMIDRPPIFLNYSDQDMKQYRFRHQLLVKYGRFLNISKDLMDFKESDPLESFNRTSVDNIATHKDTLDDGNTRYYHENSKQYLNTNPNIQDPKSIQYASAYRVYLLVKNKQNIWEFPTLTLTDQQSFADGKNILKEDVGNQDLRLSFTPKKPVYFEERQLNEQEQQNPINKRIKGVKTFYFMASHIMGKINLDVNKYDGKFFNQIMHGYQEFK